ncbi:metallophosphoesterase [Micromonospora sp. NPDC049366]|uniref:metallophosphoesterase n=1 Tax=Micromonospora sp. NPDC049366 TaxID=3364271 RepID=UPI0037A3D8A9
MLSALAFVGVIALVTGLIHFYLWKRLVRDTTAPGRWRRIGAIAALVLALLIPATLIGTRAELYWLAWPGYLWLALMFYLLVLLLVLEVPMLVARLVLRRRAVAAESTAAAPEPVLVGAAGPTGPPAAEAVAQPDHDRSRRLLLARGAAVFAGLTAAGVTGYGVRNAFGPPELDRVRIPLARLPRSMDGLRIATVSDIHLGPLLGRAHTERIVSMINRLDADLVAVVGDLVDGTVAELGPAAAPLRDLRSRYGSFFVTGNHEYYSGAEEWVREVDRLGLRVLQNQRVEIAARGGVLDLAGVNDPSGGEPGSVDGPDYAAALGDRDPSRPVVLLAHQPIVAVEAAKYGVDLQLSGHTHGGQIMPFNLAVKLEQPVVSGLGEVDGTKVYVTNGAGFWGPPVRVGANPQITLVELRAP